jgi:hypothetical protein
MAEHCISKSCNMVTHFINKKKLKSDSIKICLKSEIFISSFQLNNGIIKELLRDLRLPRERTLKNRNSICQSSDHRPLPYLSF